MKQTGFRLRIKEVFFSLLVVATGINCFGVVYQTNPCSHPDSRYHLYGFSYFENHWWPPDLNSDDLVYSPYGNSRVYSGEIVYLVYGKLTALAKKMGVIPSESQPPDFLANPYEVCQPGRWYAGLRLTRSSCVAVGQLPRR